MPVDGGTGVPWRLTRGATVEADGAVTFSVWAPRCPSLTVRITDAGGAARAELPMRAGPGGVHTARAAAGVAAAGDDYIYLLPGIGPRPDPVSRLQPAGVHGP